MHRCTDAQIHRYTDTQIHRYTDTQIHRYTDTQINGYTDTQIHRYTDTNDVVFCRERETETSNLLGGILSCECMLPSNEKLLL
jgi:hypothetical protein